jgi:eukaryotic-like serine/threonine-protein kinase
MSRGRRSRLAEGQQVLGKISAGGMGEVLLARRTGAHGFEKLVAIKTIREELARRDDIRTMFLDEARIMARVDHPAIPQIYDLEESDGNLYITMEYVAGVSLSELSFEVGGALPPAVAARFVAEACRGLHAVHELCDLSGRPLNIVHRDISPQNLILTFDGRVKILDFGIALFRDRRAQVTQVGSVKGKLSYMAPEQLSGGSIDRRADIFALAAVLYGLLTGQRALGHRRSLDLYAGKDPSAETVVPPSRLADAIPAALERAVMCGLAALPDDRFGDAKQMALALDAAVEDSPKDALDDFVRTVLAEEAAAHRSRLRELLGDGEGSSEDAPSSRTAASPAKPSETVFERSAPDAITETTRDTASIGAFASEPADAAARTARPKRRRMAAIAAVGALAGAAIAIVMALTDGPRERDPSPRPPSITEDLAPTALAAPAAAPPAAEPAEPPPAAAADVDKARPAGRARRKRPQPARNETAPIPEPALEPAPTIFGFLSLDSDPYAVVIVDGKDLGFTPIIRHRLPAGPHDLELLDPVSRGVITNRRIEVQEHKPLVLKLP